MNTARPLGRWPAASGCGVLTVLRVDVKLTRTRGGGFRMFCECGKAVKGFQGLGGHRRVCPLRVGRRADGATESRPRARAVQVSQTSSLTSRSSRLRSPVRALPAFSPVQSLSLDGEERQIRARELEVRRQ